MMKKLRCQMILQINMMDILMTLSNSFLHQMLLSKEPTKTHGNSSGKTGILLSGMQICI